MTTTLTVTAKGQVTLRKDVLRHLGVQPGDRIAVELLPQGKMIVEAVPTGSIHELFGRFRGTVTQPVSLEEMNQVIADGWVGRE